MEQLDWQVPVPEHVRDSSRSQNLHSWLIFNWPGEYIRSSTPVEHTRHRGVRLDANALTLNTKTHCEAHLLAASNKLRMRGPPQFTGKLRRGGLESENVAIGCCRFLFKFQNITPLTFKDTTTNRESKMKRPARTSDNGDPGWFGTRAG